MIQDVNVSVFLGAVVQPKTKEPVWVRRKLDTYRTIEIFRGFAYQEIIGEGYLDGGDMGNEYLNSQIITGFPRSHTPQGIQTRFKGEGFGTCLYTGLVLIASAIEEGEIIKSARGRMPGSGHGICSDSKSRSNAASEWWDAAVKRGLAQQETGECTYDCDGGDEDKEEIEDEDLSGYMSSRSWMRIKDEIASAVERYSEWSFAGNLSIRCDLERTVSSEGGPMTADYYTLSSAEKHHLVPVRDTVQGTLTAWAKSTTFEGTYDKDAILALNVSQQPIFAVGRLAECARRAGATDSEVTAMLMRNRFGVDLLQKTIGGSVGSRESWALASRFGGEVERNPRRRRVPMHEPRPVEARQNPEPTRGEKLELERANDRLQRLRDDLGWNQLEDLP